MLRILLTLSLLATTARAVTVDFSTNPNEQVNAPLTGTSLADRPELAGQIIHESSSPFVPNNTGLPGLTGTLHTQIIRADNSNTLDFYAWVDVAADSVASVTEVRLNGFPLPSVDVDFRTDQPGDVAPTQILIGQDKGIRWVEFPFNADPVAPGQSSNHFFIRTTATAFIENGSAVISGRTPDQSVAFADAISPAVPIPLPPAAWVALATFAVAIISSAVRTRQRASC